MSQQEDLKKAKGSFCIHERTSGGISIIIIMLILGCFVALNMRHFSEPFRDHAPPFVGEPYYAIRSVNYLRHGYVTNFLGVCNNLNPNPERLIFKSSEMPAYFVVNSLILDRFGVKTMTYRTVEMAYAVLLFLLISMSAWKSFDAPTAILTSLFMLLIPVNTFLLYVSWIHLFPIATLFFFIQWRESRSLVYYVLTILALALGCLHHAVGYFVMPIIVVCVLIDKSFVKDFKALAGLVFTAALLGIAYVVQTRLLHQNLDILGNKLLWESLINLRYLKHFLSIHLKKIIIGYHGLITIPLTALAISWLIRTLASSKRNLSGNQYVLMLFLLPFTFSIVFLQMVLSHFHFWTLFAPFLAMASSRFFLGWEALWRKRKRIQILCMGLLVIFLAFMSYRTQGLYDLIIWNRHNERGHALAHQLKRVLNEKESVAGVYKSGGCFNCMSPAFHFYLQRNYYGDITNLDQLLELMKQNSVSLFLLPAKLRGEESRKEQMLRKYLFRNFPLCSDSTRSDLLIFDLRQPLIEDMEPLSRRSDGRAAPHIPKSETSPS